MANRLADATSPYLLQHQDNPVNWFEWEDEAFTQAHERDVPVILSVGYSSCHWCHVMAHESFEDEETAAYMNEQFVSIKVDREERPDVDRVYMDAVTSMMGHGGWPMTVFLTPDAKPIFAGTYFPKTRTAHHPSFMDVMTAVLEIWDTDRAGAIAQADHIAEMIGQSTAAESHLPQMHDLDRAVFTLLQMFDQANGGFGRAPKFPQVPTLEFLVRMAALRRETEAGRVAATMLIKALTAMANGGIYDHLFGGFARYSVDAQWEIPHFEKMLYDNALLARMYLRAWQVTGIDRFADISREVLDYLDGRMADISGGLHSAEDADSEGMEGKFAVWAWDELGAVLGDDRALAAAIYGATPQGNFGGANNLHRRTDIVAVSSETGLSVGELRVARDRIDERLRTARSKRIPPGRDDKIVTAWNGLALRAFAEAGVVLDEPRYSARAIAIAEFLLGHASPGGELVRSWRDRPGHQAFADDLASTALGLYTLFGTTGEERWFTSAESMVGTLRSHFADPNGGFFATRGDADDLIARPKNTQDNPTPSDNSLALEALLVHSALTGDRESTIELEASMRILTGDALSNPAFGGYTLAVWLTHIAGVREVAIVGSPSQRAELVRPIWGAFRPDVVLATGDGSATSVPLLADRSAGDTGLAYICKGLVCDLPVATPEDVVKALA